MHPAQRLFLQFEIGEEYIMLHNVKNTELLADLADQEFDILSLLKVNLAYPVLASCVM